jgi:hypothetical protein
MATPATRACPARTIWLVPAQLRTGSEDLPVPSLGYKSGIQPSRPATESTDEGTQQPGSFGCGPQSVSQNRLLGQLRTRAFQRSVSSGSLPSTIKVLRIARARAPILGFSYLNFLH